MPDDSYGRSVRNSSVVLADKILAFEWPDAKIKSLTGVSEESSSTSTKRRTSLGGSALKISE